MPIINRDDAAEVEEHIARVFEAPQDDRAEALRRMFVEKLDFAPATGSVSLAGARSAVDLPAQAERLATMEGVTAVFVPLDIADSDRVRKAEAAEAAKLISNQLTGDLLLVMTNKTGSQIHFIYPTFETSTPYLRRMVIERDLPRRTAVQQLSNIYWRWDAIGSIHRALEEAFDVEAVTTEFFNEYKRLFDLIMGQVEGFGGGEDEGEAKRLFVQTLFNRLMFVYFISRKGWLKFDGDNDYLNALWRNYPAQSEDRNFYTNRLRPLFFAGLNNPQSMDLIKNNPPVYALIGYVRFLNGGLFEELDLDKRTEVMVPDDGIQSILSELFDRFNFTVMESTPFDVEVAVDPEMLGKVFEELVTGRHETGSYYTPRQVVAFMCREALKGYLDGEETGASPDAIQQFVDDRDTAGLTVTTAPEISMALSRLTALDPACGSGAYLVGMLQELVDLETALYSEKLIRDPKSLHELKLQIIERNLYGADIDPFAVNIAMLRLWLSLAIEFDGESPPPLPNLDFKIVCGDSLTSPDPAPEYQVRLFVDKSRDMRWKLKKAKANYMTAIGSDKSRLRQEIEDMETDLIEALDGRTAADSSVEWRVQFAEVFDRRGGFDIAIANPPYVRADAQFKHLQHAEAVRQAAIAQWKDYRAELRRIGVYVSLYEKWDLFVPFLERAHQLLREGGQMAFIVSDAYNAAKYTERSHEYFLINSVIVRLDFCSDIPLFMAGINNTILHFAKSKPDDESTVVRAYRWGDKPDDFERNNRALQVMRQKEAGRSAFRVDAVARSVTSVETITLEFICYVSKGMVINSNERGYQGAFTAGDLLSDDYDHLHPKRFVLGKDIAKWQPDRVRYLEWGTVRAPSQFSRPTFPELQEAREKLLAVRTPGPLPKVMFDEGYLGFDASSVGFVPWQHLEGVRNRSISKAARYRDQMRASLPGTTLTREAMEGLSREFHLKYLLAIMNSQFAVSWFTGRRRSKRHLYPDDWKNLPIPIVPEILQLQVVEYVDAILGRIDSRTVIGSEIQPIENELDRLIDSLYQP